jgi:hypothetical protein
MLKHQTGRLKLTTRGVYAVVPSPHQFSLRLTLPRALLLIVSAVPDMDEPYFS